MAQHPQIGVYNLPPPDGGWNERDAITDMPESDARRLINWFPAKGRVTMFKGSRLHGRHEDNEVIHTLVTHTTATGAQQLLACENETWVDYSTYSSPSEITPGTTTPTSDKWQTINGNYNTVFFNGEDTPQIWNGTDLDDATYTAVGLTATNLIGGCMYRERAYVIEKDTLSVWYAGAQAITGAVTEFDMAYVFNLGGYLMAAATWTHDDGGGLDDRLVCISSEGEVLVYDGDYPGGTFSRIGQYYLPKPLGRRCTFRMGGDLFIITEEGIIGLGEVAAKGAGGDYVFLTDKIGPAWVDAVASSRALWGWEAKLWRGGPYLIVNIPTSTTDSDQFIRNTQTGAWCKRTGWNATTWEVFGNKLYYASTSKHLAGVVYEANYGVNDEIDLTATPATAGRAKHTDLKTAFSYFGNPLIPKLFTNADLVFLADGDMETLCDVNVDFEDVAITDSLTVTGEGGGVLWNSSLWNTVNWARSMSLVTTQVGLSGFGTAAALVLKGDYTDLMASFYGAKVFYEPAGF